MAILKKGQQYLHMSNSYFDDYDFRVYECDKEPEFEMVTNDWNNDGDINAQYGIYLKTIEGYHNYQWITQSEFNYAFYEYVETTKDLIFINNRSKERFKLILEVNHKGIDFVGVSNIYGYKTIIKKSDGVIIPKLPCVK